MLMNPHPAAEKLQAAWVSLAVTALLVVVKLAVGIATNSLAILSLAAESGIDLAAVVITLLAVRVSSIPPDEDHPYGHGKFESLSALAQGLLLLGIGIWIGISAVQHLNGVPEVVDANIWSFGVLIFSTAVDFGRGKLLHNASRDHSSAALKASALHFFTDSLSSLVTAVALLLIRIEHWFQADSWAALIVAAVVAYLSVRIILESVDGLTDRYQKTGDYDRLKSMVERVQGVESATRVRMRTGGPVLFVEVSIAISRVLPFAAVSRIVAEVERAILLEFPNAEVTVHWRPVRTPSETPFETLKMVATEYGLMPHNTELSKMKNGKTALDYHLEFRAGTSLLDAERISEEIELELRRELPELGNIFVHLEEERRESVPSRAEEIERPELLGRASDIARNISPKIKNIQELHVFRDASSALKLVMTVDLPQALSLKEAHEIVTQIESELRKQFPELHRILIQTEPTN